MLSAECLSAHIVLALFEGNRIKHIHSWESSRVRRAFRDSLRKWTWKETVIGSCLLFSQEDCLLTSTSCMLFSKCLSYEEPHRCHVCFSRNTLMASSITRALLVNCSTHFLARER